MTEYVDSWVEFRHIVASTSKKLLKKPNYALALIQLGSLSLRMQDEEIPQHAAMCHVEMANINKKLGNANEERKQLLVAAKLLLQAYRVYRKSGSRVHCSHPSDMCDYYTRAIKIAMDLKEYRLAGMTSIEAAKVMLECQVLPMALEHLQRAVRLVEGEFYAHTQALYLLAEIHLAMNNPESVLSAIDNLWITVMKTRPKTFLGRKMLKDCEVITMLALQKAKMTPAGRHKVLRELYGQTTGLITEKSPSRVCVKEESALLADEFAAFKHLLSLLQQGLNDDARRLAASDDCLFLSELARKLIVHVTTL